MKSTSGTYGSSEVCESPDGFRITASPQLLEQAEAFTGASIRSLQLGRVGSGIIICRDPSEQYWQVFRPAIFHLGCGLGQGRGEPLQSKAIFDALWNKVVPSEDRAQYLLFCDACCEHRRLR